MASQSQSVECLCPDCTEAVKRISLHPLAQKTWRALQAMSDESGVDLMLRFSAPHHGREKTVVIKGGKP